MNYLVAVSGGVDSVVLLDILSRGDQRLIVAHVDHGIRPESGEDARFVEGLAAQYGLPYVQTRLKLGPDASEELARRGRYDFLQQQAGKYNATIVTAHHRDDLIGSIAINLLRGTGWRGLAVMNRPGISRPLLHWRKSQVYDYALRQRLEWTEDSTNASQQYLRNRLRAGVHNLSDEISRQLATLRARQLQLSRDIDRESSRSVRQFGDLRHPYTMIDPGSAIELLRYKYGITRPMAERLLLGIKTARAGTQAVIKVDLAIKFSQKTFEVAPRPSDVKVIK